MSDFIPLAGILAGIIIPLAVFLLIYLEEKGKRETALEIAKHLDAAKKLEELLAIFEKRKKEPIDYRRSGVVTLFVGVGIYLLGAAALGSFIEGAGMLVSAIGLGVLVAGYLYPNTSEEITRAVEEFENK